LSLAALWLAFALPLVLCGLVPDASRFRLELELPLLWTLASTNAVHWRSRVLHALLTATAIALVLYRADQWVCLLLMREPPLLYDQWFMARHLGVLIADLLSPLTALLLLGLGLLAWGVTRASRAALTHARRLREAWPRSARQLGVFWLLALGLTLLTPRVGWLTPGLLDNIQASRAIYAQVRETAAHSPRTELMAKPPRERPDILLFIVESYGRLLSVEPGTRDEHGALLAELERELTGAGFSAASAFATATVSGGRSWIAEGTLLMGMPIRYESVFQHLVAQHPPSLVSYLDQAGYHTMLLAPADRDRRGAHVENRYGFDQLITYANLDYRGPPIGWGLVPDGFSLAYAERHLLAARAEPVFLDFHMVSSHAPWEDVPALEADTSEVAQEQRIPEYGSTALEQVATPLGRYDRGERSFMWMGQLDDQLRRGYQATISYDLRLIARYLARRQRDALVIVLGDHQPPVISRADQSYDTPLHILSRDPQRLSPLRARGFVPGLRISASAPPALAHEGLFPLLVELLGQ
jgi:Sulfatase